MHKPGTKIAQRAVQSFRCEKMHDNFKKRLPLAKPYAMLERELVSVLEECENSVVFTGPRPMGYVEESAQR